MLVLSGMQLSLQSFEKICNGTREWSWSFTSSDRVYKNM